ncbi:elongation factor P [Buchnera aphidicola (Macrosiphoniella sanborni)]|uniref:Elongation factor P n=1 Tax=Buchnera aphidicola (Macrosiphoniella sanborni) TaxID=1241865 RepID=A0A4D6YC16_9GAMM|nr:elongation factor P [Buchnera aphidicola]QCI23598.1 elongation factor P [Buchnera aphidicola (Macrosiphoniella sanborni)]
MGFSNHFRSGCKIIFEQEPCVIESSEFVKPGKGQAFFRVKMRKLLTKQLIEKTFKSTAYLEIANIQECTLSYLYNNGRFWYFMKNNTFEELSIEKRIIGTYRKWLLPQDICTVTFWNNKPISILPKNFVNLKVIDVQPVAKGNTVNTSGSTKLAKLITGAIVKVPLFIQIGYIIKIDTRSGQYVSRLK